MDRNFAKGGNSANVGRGDDFGMRPHTRIMQNASHDSKCLLHHSFGYPLWMVTPNERLRIAREKAGYESATDAASALGMSRATYIQHENGTQGRGLPAKAVPKYARKFKVSEQWLLFGKGDGPTIPLEPNEDELAGMLRLVMEEIPLGTTLGEWPRRAASSLHTQLEQFRADRRNHSQDDSSTAPDKSAQSPGATRPDARG